MIDLKKLEEMLAAAQIALPVVNPSLNGHIESADGKFLIYDEGDATEEAATYLVALLNAGPELIAMVHQQETALAELQGRMGGLLLVQAGLVDALTELADTAEKCDSWESFPPAPIEKARIAAASAKVQA